MEQTAPQPAEERLPLLVRHLLRPEAYPHRPDHVEFKQTHISYVFIAGDYVYKLKTPLRFSFLDYSTLERRAHFCSEEVRLNRRLAPEVYLGVVPIIDRRGRFIVAEDMIVTDRWLTYEYAVKMHRLPEEHMFDQLLKTGRVETQTLRAIARKLASFHQTAATDKAAQYGNPACIEQAVQDNFQETATYIGQTIGQQMFETLRNYQQQFLAEHQALLLRRVESGWVCEGHGDLRAEHICLDAQLSIFDCIEQQRKHATPFSDLPDHVHIVVSTDTALERGLAKVEDFVGRCPLFYFFHQANIAVDPLSGGPTGGIFATAKEGIVS